MKRQRDAGAAGAGHSGESFQSLALGAVLDEVALPAATYDSAAVRQALFAIRAVLLAAPEREVRTCRAVAGTLHAVPSCRNSLPVGFGSRPGSSRIPCVPSAVRGRICARP